MTENFKLDGTINTDRLIKLAEWKMKLRNLAKEEGKHDYAAYYERQMLVYDRMADHIAINALMATSELLAIPEIATSVSVLALPMNSESFNADIEEAEQAIEIKHTIGDEAHKQIIRGKLNSPKAKKQVQEFKENIATIGEKLQVEGFDLFALNNQKELAINLKLKRQRVLNAEEEKQLFAKEIRTTVLEMLRSGARPDAIDLLKNYMFRDRHYSENEIHKLLDSLKHKFKVKEPKTSPKIKALYIGNFSGQWLKISYQSGTKIVGNVNKTITESIIGRYNPEEYDGIMGADGKIICDIKSIIKFIPVTPREMELIKATYKNI